MLKYMDLCVQLQQHRQAKDGLHQYRNMAQQQAPGSLEVRWFHVHMISTICVPHVKAGNRNSFVPLYLHDDMSMLTSTHTLARTR